MYIHTHSTQEVPWFLKSRQRLRKELGVGHTRGWACQLWDTVVGDGCEGLLSLRGKRCMVWCFLFVYTSYFQLTSTCCAYVFCCWFRWEKNNIFRFSRPLFIFIFKTNNSARTKTPGQFYEKKKSVPFSVFVWWRFVSVRTGQLKIIGKIYMYVLKEIELFIGSREDQFGVKE